MLMKKNLFQENLSPLLGVPTNTSDPVAPKETIDGIN